MAPIIPFISDDDEALEETVRAIAEAGATHVAPIVLHLRKGGAREWFLRWARECRPDLTHKFLDLYGNGAYAPKAYQDEIGEKVRRLARRYGVGKTTGRRARRIPEPRPGPEQLSLV